MADADEGGGGWLGDLDDSGDLHPREWREAWRQAEDAISAGDDAALRRVLADHPGMAGDVTINEPLLTAAAELGRGGAVAALLEAGVPANSINANGGTALMDAAWNGHAAVVRLLLDAGADPDILVEEQCGRGDPEVVGRCALFFALVKGHREVVELLEPLTDPAVRALAYRELPGHLQWLAENPPPHGPTVHLFVACQGQRPDRLRAAIAAGGDVNYRLLADACNRLFGGTPLSFAAATGRLDLVGPLLEAGADPGLAGLDGRAPADIAALNGHEAIAEMLRSARRPPAAGRG